MGSEFIKADEQKASAQFGKKNFELGIKCSKAAMY